MHHYTELLSEGRQRPLPAALWQQGDVCGRPAVVPTALPGPAAAELWGIPAARGNMAAGEPRHVRADRVCVPHAPSLHGGGQKHDTIPGVTAQAQRQRVRGGHRRESASGVAGRLRRL